MIRAMYAKPEASGSTNCCQAVLLCLEAPAIFVADALDAGDKRIAFVFEATEANATGVG